MRHRADGYFDCRIRQRELNQKYALTAKGRASTRRRRLRASTRERQARINQIKELL